MKFKDIFLDHPQTECLVLDGEAGIIYLGIYVFTGQKRWVKFACDTNSAAIIAHANFRIIAR